MNDIERLRDLALSETGFLFDPYSGATFSLNPSAVAILRALRGGADRAQVLGMLTSEFDAASADLEHDVDEFVALLRREGLVSREFSLS
jgi:PqqD family protein of HPr-rel-A system